jgi:hypothetical protein
MEKIYVVGDSRTNQENPITKIYSKFFMAFVISGVDDIIVETEAVCILSATNSFIRNIFVGKNFIKDQELIISEIKKTYLGLSQKSIIVAYKDALKKYINAKKEYTYL